MRRGNDPILLCPLGIVGGTVLDGAGIEACERIGLLACVGGALATLACGDILALA